MTKRMNGEGSWSKRKINGIEYYSFRKSYPEGRKEFTGKTKKQVDLKVAEYEKKRENVTVKTTEYFGEYALNYVKNIASKNIGKTTLDNYIDIINTRVAPHEFIIGELQLGQINKAYLTQYIQKLVDKKYARATIVKTMRVVRNAIEYGIKENKINKDVLEDFKTPSESHVLTPKREIPFLSKEDMAKVYSEAKKEKYGNNGYALILIMYTGIRAGEMQDLQWKDIDFENKKMDIRTTAVRVRNKDDNYVVQSKSSPKSKAGIRTIPLCKQSIEALKYFEKQNNNHKPNDLVCINLSGKRIDQSNLRRTLKIILTNSDSSVVEHCGLHALRHSFGSRLLEEGVDIKVVSILMGHEKISTTYDHYIHILNQRITSSVKIFED